jgi:DnaK suppressor protein
MVTSKQKAGKSAQAAKAPARAKPAARGAAGASSKAAAKPVAKAKSAPAKAPVKAVPAKKAVAKPVAKSAPARAPAKAVPAKKVAAVVPPKKAATPPAAAKTAPAKPGKAPTPAATAAKPTTSSSTDNSRKFVTTSKPEASPVAKTARKKAPPSDNGVTMQDGRYVLPATVTIDIPANYKPDPKDDYMSPRHLQYFRNKLSKWREELVEESRQTIESLRDEVRDVGDEAERATRETENSLELRTRDRYRKLIAKIDKALKRIEEGRYGFCEETDEEIGLDRLEARPIATLSLDAQERWEHRQKQMGD